MEISAGLNGKNSIQTLKMTPIKSHPLQETEALILTGLNEAQWPSHEEEEGKEEHHLCGSLNL